MMPESQGDAEHSSRFLEPPSLQVQEAPVQDDAPVGSPAASPPLSAKSSDDEGPEKPLLYSPGRSFPPPTPSEQLSQFMVGMTAFVGATSVAIAATWPFQELTSLGDFFFVDKPFLWTIYGCFFVGHTALYFICRTVLRVCGAEYRDSQKADSWLMTLLAGMIVFSFGCWALVEIVVRGGFNERGFRAIVRSDPWPAKISNLYYLANCHADLVVGSLVYPAAIDMLTGWIHHAATRPSCATACRTGSTSSSPSSGWWSCPPS
ncbi:unnamed protein product [Vitrella brassicaformis CCMP3155]|uniref:TLC domain-containing protein n=1 Tax=Vitrella brassicaformis (strain CCMP3155) TaxID=1169540 RepID=A0A0G4F1E7_VITBC|nr:unnamed protein product [Vitrella brassicaformis CCMP3155]|eukprot:CEM05210.1 unnamed protein product [Vitrella brassicaformis CCMP3155]